MKLQDQPETFFSLRAAFLNLSCLSVLLLLVASPVVAQWGQWKAPDPAELAQKTAQVEKDADAEALLWEVWVNDAEQDTEYRHSLRIKIFTERGKEVHSKFEIPYFTGVNIKDIAGRTIKPDGTIVELKKESIFDREVVKFGRIKVKVKSIAMPAVEPGVIIEYRWREIHVSQMADNVALQFQREIPVQLVRYYVKPYPYAVSSMKYKTFNTEQQAQFVRDKDGFNRLELAKMPAFHEEDYMPPANQVRAWMLVFYAPSYAQSVQQYWMEQGNCFMAQWRVRSR